MTRAEERQCQFVSKPSPDGLKWAMVFGKIKTGERACEQLVCKSVEIAKRTCKRRRNCSDRRRCLVGGIQHYSSNIELIKISA